jgi:hypothetical protein
LTEKAKPTKVRQYGPTLKCSLREVKEVAGFKTSAVSPELQDVPFEMPLEEFETRFNAEIFRGAGVSSSATPTRFERLFIRNIYILDIASDNRVCVGWSWCLREIGSVYTEYATALFSGEQVASMIQDWQAFIAIKEARLDDESVDNRRNDMIRQKGLDEEAVKIKRAEALREAGLDEQSIRTAREVIRQRLRVEKESIPPPASRPS